MLMMVAVSRSLASARDLASFHLERAAIYRVLAEVVGAPPTPRALASLRAVLEEARISGHPEVRDLARALDGEGAAALVRRYFDLIDGSEGLPDFRCFNAEQAIRREVVRKLRRAPDPSATSELLLLSQLAERCGRAMRQGDLSEASQLSHLTQRFLEEHGAVCLGRLCACLIASDLALYAHTGELLRHRLERISPYSTCPIRLSLPLGNRSRALVTHW
jgi:hypothetical protein